MALNWIPLVKEYNSVWQPYIPNNETSQKIKPEFAEPFAFSLRSKLHWYVYTFWWDPPTVSGAAPRPDLGTAAWGDSCCPHPRSARGWPRSLRGGRWEGRPRRLRSSTWRGGRRRWFRGRLKWSLKMFNLKCVHLLKCWLITYWTKLRNKQSNFCFKYLKHLFYILRHNNWSKLFLVKLFKIFLEF